MTGLLRSLAKKIPSYLLHKPSGQARVRIDGKDHYLGVYGSEESRRKYGELIATHSAGVPVDPFRGQPGKENWLMIKELTVAFTDFADGHYVKNGKPTSEVHCIHAAIRPLNKLYGETEVDEFGPLMLKTVRTEMIETGWVRKSVNRAIGRIRHIFKWGVENELVKPETLQRLQAVAPLLAGRTDAPDNDPRSAASEADVEAVRVEVSPLVRDLIDLQRLTGARSGELLSLTTRMINRGGNVWLASLSNHKNVHHGKVRMLAIGPKAQLIVTRYLKADQDEKLFPIRREAYCRAITRACDRLELDRWVPHQLRHTAAEVVREEFGLEHAQAVLGHAKANMAEHYAKLSARKAVEVAARIG